MHKTHIILNNYQRPNQPGMAHFPPRYSPSLCLPLPFRSRSLGGSSSAHPPASTSPPRCCQPGR